jgi:hypothetical protein
MSVWQSLSPKKIHSCTTRMYYSPFLSVQRVHAVPIGMSFIEGSSGEKPWTFTSRLGPSVIRKLLPQTQVSACVSSSHLASSFQLWVEGPCCPASAITRSARGWYIARHFPDSGGWFSPGGDFRLYLRALFHRRAFRFANCCGVSPPSGT